VFKLPLPIGFIGLFVGIRVPVGIGFELEGKIEIAEIGFDVSAHAEATAELGLLCPAAGGECTGMTSFDTPPPEYDFELIAPDPSEQFKLELSGKGYVFARPSIGASFSQKAQFEFLAASTGVKQSVDLAAATRQASDAEYASGFKLDFLLDIGPGKDLTAAIEKLGDLLGVNLGIVTESLTVDIDKPIAESPNGTFTITPATVQPGNDEQLGEMVTFTVELDPVTYMGIGSVERVEIFWKKDDGAGGFTLEPGRPGCTDIVASPGQTTFECQTDFLEEHTGKQTFYAFVHAKLFGIPLPVPLEVVEDGMKLLQVGGQIEGLGLQYPLDISYDGGAVFGAGKLGEPHTNSLLLWRAGEELTEVASGEGSVDPENGGLSSNAHVIAWNRELDESPFSQAFKWVNGTSTPIEGMDRATAVSGDGIVVLGLVDTDNDGRHAITSTGQDLGRAIVRASDSTGTVLVGNSWDAAKQGFVATIWRNGARTQVGGFGATHDVSPDGTWAVGSSEGMAFRHQAGVGLTQLWSGDARSVSRDGGIVVGAASGIGPVLWTEWDGLRPLLDVLEVECGYHLQGWNPYAPWLISPDGTVIVGFGANPAGIQEAWRVPLCAAVTTRPGSS
jgi:hypothetical protein